MVTRNACKLRHGPGIGFEVRMCSWTYAQRISAGLILVLLASRVFAVTHYWVDSDEPQHLYGVWGWVSGMVQYRDLFDNHAPVFREGGQLQGTLDGQTIETSQMLSAGPHTGGQRRRGPNSLGLGAGFGMRL